MDAVHSEANQTVEHLVACGRNFDHCCVNSRDIMAQALLGFAPDIILSDWAASDFSGKQALSLLKEMQFDTPLIVVNRTMDERYIIEAMRHGARDYLLKHDLSSLEAVIDRELAAAEVRKTRALDMRRFKAMVEKSQEGLSIIGADGRTLYQSPAVERMFGWSPEQALQMKWHDYVPVQDRARLFKILKRILKKSGATTTVDFRVMHRSGELRWGRFDVTNHLDDPVIGGLVANFRDITNEKITAERDRLLFTQNPLPMYFFEAKTRRFLDVNTAVLSTYGYTREEMLGGMTVDQLIHPSEREAVRAAIGQTQALGRSSIMRRQHIAKSGAAIDVEVSAHAVDADKNTLLTVVRDRTERLKLEAQLLQAQKMEAIGGLAGGVAHDFNNLATIILSYTSAILEDLKDGDPLRSDIKEVHAAGERARALTRQLLAFSGRQIVHQEVIDLHYVVAQMQTMLGRLLAANIKFVLQGQEAVTPILGDATQIEQILLNLVVNARDAMPQGGKLRVTTERVILDKSSPAEVAALERGPYALLCVSDTGQGMDAKVRARIFEPFFTTKAKERGTGLGLSTVFGLVQQSAGSIFLDTELGKGTTFRIYFPIAS